VRDLEVAMRLSTTSTAIAITAVLIGWGCRKDTENPETESPNDAAPGDSPLDGDPEDPVVPVDDAGEGGAPDGTNLSEGEAEECTEEHARMGHCRREVTTEPQ
jgi:hypothetical protein